MEGDFIQLMSTTSDAILRQINVSGKVIQGVIELGKAIAHFLSLLSSPTGQLDDEGVGKLEDFWRICKRTPLNQGVCISTYQTAILALASYLRTHTLVPLPVYCTGAS